MTIEPYRRQQINFDPKTFSIGLVNFCSMLLPGAAYLLIDGVGPAVQGDWYAKLAGAEAWAAFPFGTYLLGHLVFLFVSRMEGIYDWLRDLTLNRQVAGRVRLLVWLIAVPAPQKKANAVVSSIHTNDYRLSRSCAVRREYAVRSRRFQRTSKAWP